MDSAQFVEPGSPVLAVGLDGAEWTLVQTLMAEGRMPRLHSLLMRGAHGALTSDALRFAGAVWPTFYTSSQVGGHGIYHNKLWRHEAMRCEMADEGWLHERPFWERPELGAYRIGVLDVPMTLGKPRSLNGCQLYGWGTHDLITRGSWPPGLWPDLQAKFGKPLVPPESFGAQSPCSRKRLADALLGATDQVGDLAAHLLQQQAWDLFMVVFGAAHRAGHYLWPEEGGRSADLEAIYQELDRALGKLLDLLPAARILVFAVHGMGPNPGWSDHCGLILEHLQREKSGRAPAQGLLYRIRQHVPWPIIRQVTRLLPRQALDQLVALWSARMLDWSETRFFPLPMDQAGYIRINLQGREPAGIVAPGEEYRQLCLFLQDAFLGLRDRATRKSIVRRVHTREELAAPDDPYRDRLPDLVVEWGDLRASACEAIVSERYGEIPLPPDRCRSGRTGNHRNRGWFVAAGSGIGPAGMVEGYTILDVAPTICQWLQAAAPASFRGRPIEEIASPAAFSSPATGT